MMRAYIFAQNQSILVAPHPRKNTPRPHPHQQYHPPKNDQPTPSPPTLAHHRHTPSPRLWNIQCLNTNIVTILPILIPEHRTHCSLLQSPSLSRGLPFSPANYQPQDRTPDTTNTIPSTPLPHMPHHICIPSFHTQTINPLPSTPHDNTQNKLTRTTHPKQLSKRQPHILTRLLRTKRSALAKRRETYLAKLYTTYKLRPLSNFWPNILPQSLPIHLHKSTRTQPQPPYSLHSLGWKPTNPLNKTSTKLPIYITNSPHTYNQTPTHKYHKNLGSPPQNTT
jgi:hypothetical protein